MSSTSCLCQGRRAEWTWTAAPVWVGSHVMDHWVPAESLLGSDLEAWMHSMDYSCSRGLKLIRRLFHLTRPSSYHELYLHCVLFSRPCCNLHFNLHLTVRPRPRYSLGYPCCGSWPRKRRGIEFLSPMIFLTFSFQWLMLFPKDSGDLEGSLLAFGSLRACTMVSEGFPFYSSGILRAVKWRTQINAF